MTTPIAPWTPTAIENRSTQTLTASSTNARTHKKDQIAKLAASISAYGFPVPILIDTNGVIIAGHGRWAAAKKLKLQTVPCIVADHLNEEQRRAYTIADNHIASLSEWDEQLLAQEITTLAKIIPDLSPIGFDTSEIDRFIGNATPIVANQNDELPTETKNETTSIPGQTYTLGGHKLICGQENLNYCDTIRRRWTTYAKQNNLDAGDGALE